MAQNNDSTNIITTLGEGGAGGLLIIVWLNRMLVLAKIVVIKCIFRVILGKIAPWYLEKVIEIIGWVSNIF